MHPHHRAQQTGASLDAALPGPRRPLVPAVFLLLPRHLLSRWLVQELRAKAFPHTHTPSVPTTDTEEGTAGNQGPGASCPGRSSAQTSGEAPRPPDPIQPLGWVEVGTAVPGPRSLQTQQQPGRFPPEAGQRHRRGSPGPRELPGRPCLTSSRARIALPPARPPVFCRESPALLPAHLTGLSLLLTEALYLHGQDTRVRLMGDVPSLRPQRGAECPP